MYEIISVKNLTKIYDNLIAVNDITFEVTKGEIVGLLGPNGAGKTTIIKSMLNLVDYKKGKVLIKGKNMKKNKFEMLKHIGAVLEGARNIYWYMTPSENINYFAGIMGLTPSKIKKRKNRILKQLDLWKVKDKPVREFSKGMKQKTSIACSLIHDPSILFLDEPTLGLDIETKNYIKTMLKNISKNENKTIIVTSHNMQFIENICDNIIIIDNGKIVSNSNLSILKRDFSKRKYTILTDKKLVNISKKEIKNLGDFKIKLIENKAELIIYLNGPNNIYNLFNILQEYNVEIYDICIKNSSLEDIFIDLIEKKEIE